MFFWPKHYVKWHGFLMIFPIKDVNASIFELVRFKHIQSDWIFFICAWNVPSQRLNSAWWLLELVLLLLHPQLKWTVWRKILFLWMYRTSFIHLPLLDPHFDYLIIFHQQEDQKSNLRHISWCICLQSRDGGTSSTWTETTTTSSTSTMTVTSSTTTTGGDGRVWKHPPVAPQKTRVFFV